MGTSSTSYIYYSATDAALTDPDQVTKEGRNDSETNHSIELKGLDPDLIYYFKVESTDTNDATSTSAITTFETDDDVGPDIDTDPPTTPILTHESVAILFTTDEPAKITLDYGEVSGTYTDQETINTYDETHYIVLLGLEADTDYYYQITTTDIADNVTYFSEYEFTTDPAPGQDHDPLDYLDGIEADPVTDTKAVIKFSSYTAADDLVGANCTIEYGTTTSLTELPIDEEDDVYNETHSIHLTGLIAGTAYLYQVICEDNLDPANVVTDNNSGAYYTFTTEEEAGAGDDTTGPEISRSEDFCDHRRISDRELDDG